uniref:Short-chain dehydrogenase/reductase SDR n=1 Tax=Arcella intermedia TaxID=1963864 RepID=A0A6B2LJG7_9EUKA
MGVPSVLIYNAAARRLIVQGICDVSTEEFINFWKINCLGAFFWSREVLPEMKMNQSGTIIFTGATSSLRSLAGLASFSVGKFGLRSLSQSIAREVGPSGIHVAHVIIDGKVDVPLVRKYVEKQKIPDISWMSPSDIADQYWAIHKQPKSTWTYELDLRPFDEPMTAKM